MLFSFFIYSVVCGGLTSSMLIMNRETFEGGADV